MPSALDLRIASLFHIRQVHVLSRSEAAARKASKPFNPLVGEIIGILAQDIEYKQKLDLADAAAVRAYQGSRDATRDSLLAMARWAHDVTAKGMVKTIPARWFRSINPLIQEDIGPVLGKLSAAANRTVILGLIFPAPTAADALQALQRESPEGRTWDDRLGYWEGQTRAQIQQTLVTGTAQGLLLNDMTKKLRTVVNRPKFWSQRIARTESRRIAEIAANDAIDQAGDLIAGKMINEILDSVTRPHHAVRNGEIYNRVGPGEFVNAAGQQIPFLPDEPNCRGWTSPILSTPEEFEKDPAALAAFENASADTIPDPSAYDSWFSNATEPERKTAVGVGRYSAMQRKLTAEGRRPGWTDFVTEDGKLIPVGRLRAESIAARAARRGKVETVIRRREAAVREVRQTGFLPRIELPAVPGTAAARLLMVQTGTGPVAVENAPKAVTFVPDPRVTDEVTVWVDVDRFDAAWKKNEGFYIAPSGRGESEGRRERFAAFLGKGLAIEQPIVSVLDGGRIGFTNGRHRMSVLRDLGIKKMPVSVDRETAAELSRIAGVRAPKRKLVQIP